MKNLESKIYDVLKEAGVPVKQAKKMAKKTAQKAEFFIWEKKQGEDKNSIPKKETELDRAPTLDEIAERTSISREEIIQSLDAIQSPLSLYEPIYSDGGDTLYVMDQISDKKNKEDNWVQEIALCEALKKLPKREQRIIKMRFYEGKTQMEIAQEIHISQAQVSRLEKSALKTMKGYLS